MHDLWTSVMPVRYRCGHGGAIERNTCEELNYVAAYAETVLCWNCWKESHT
jgi:hypothetical protein